MERRGGLVARISSKTLLSLRKLKEKKVVLGPRCSNLSIKIWTCSKEETVGLRHILDISSGAHYN